MECLVCCLCNWLNDMKTNQCSKSKHTVAITNVLKIKLRKISKAQIWKADGMIESYSNMHLMIIKWPVYTLAARIQAKILETISQKQFMSKCYNKSVGFKLSKLLFVNPHFVDLFSYIWMLIRGKWLEKWVGIESKCDDHGDIIQSGLDEM